jgi:hypothetical protein
MKRKVSVGSDRALLPVLPKERKQRSDHNSGGGDEEGIEDVLVDKELMFLIFGPDLFTWKDLPVLASVCRYHTTHQRNTQHPPPNQQRNTHHYTCENTQARTTRDVSPRSTFLTRGRRKSGDWPT